MNDSTGVPPDSPGAESRRMVGPVPAELDWAATRASAAEMLTKLTFATRNKAADNRVSLRGNTVTDRRCSPIVELLAPGTFIAFVSHSLPEPVESLSTAAPNPGPARP